MNSLNGKQIILGVTGGIAAFKIAELVRSLIKLDAAVRVVMTDTATQFITPLTLQALSGHPVYVNLTDAEADSGMDHIALARWADLILIAPASANSIAELAHGLASNLLGTLVLASSAPLMVAPAMNQQMWLHRATQSNVDILRKRGAQIIGPATGAQACGETGPGRMLEPEEILNAITYFFGGYTSLLSDKQIVITAGPTREAIDPVRFLSNHSSGRMGFALADAAARMGAAVTLVSGPTHLASPKDVNRISVESAAEMLQAAQTACESAHIFIAAAAVADYTPAAVSEHKLKKSGSNLTLTLKRTVDILKSISLDNSRSHPLYCVGFAAETETVIEYAKKKLAEKKLDMIVANDVSRSDIGFQSLDNQVTIITPHIQPQLLPKAPKEVIAQQILTLIAEQISSK